MAVDVAAQPPTDSVLERRLGPGTPARRSTAGHGVPTQATASSVERAGRYRVPAHETRPCALPSPRVGAARAALATCAALVGAALVAAAAVLLAWPALPQPSTVTGPALVVTVIVCLAASCAPLLPGPVASLSTDGWTPACATALWLLAGPGPALALVALWAVLSLRQDPQAGSQACPTTASRATPQADRRAGRPAVAVLGRQLAMAVSLLVAQAVVVASSTIPSLGRATGLLGLEALPGPAVPPGADGPDPGRLWADALWADALWADAAAAGGLLLLATGLPALAVVATTNVVLLAVADRSRDGQLRRSSLRAVTSRFRDGQAWLAPLLLAPVLAVALVHAPALAPLVCVPLSAVDALGRQGRASKRESLLDPLTGLANRRDFARRVAEAVAAATAGQGPGCAVLLVDLDRFKHVNDVHGHAAGDTVLQVTAERLRAAVRPDDVVARLGGDEFAVLLSDLADADAALHLGQRLRRALEAPIDAAGHVVSCPGSVGIALAPAHANNVEELLERADAAMYAAKAPSPARPGRPVRAARGAQAAVAVYDRRTHRTAGTPHTLVAALREALSAATTERGRGDEPAWPSGAVVLRLQPQLRLAGGLDGGGPAARGPAGGGPAGGGPAGGGPASGGPADGPHGPGLPPDPGGTPYGASCSLTSWRARLGDVCAAEALLRWWDPVRGLAPTGELHEAAERGGLSSQLSRLALDLAVQQCARWLAVDLRLPVAVDVPAAELADPRFAPELADALARSRVPSELLTIEVDEGSLTGDLGAVRRTLRYLGALGVRLSLDGFGGGRRGGRGSLLLLRQLPVDEVKLDGALVSRVATHRDDAAVVSSLVGLADTLGIRAVALGVEDEATMTALRDIGCHRVQGTYLCPPATPGVLQDWLTGRGAPPGWSTPAGQPPVPVGDPPAVQPGDLPAVPPAVQPGDLPAVPPAVQPGDLPAVPAAVRHGAAGDPVS